MLVTAGETMLLLAPPAPGRLRHATSLGLSVGGAESNVAIGLARLGLPARWLSLLGDDEPGEVVLSRVRAEGVDTSAVRRVPGAPTGLYLREQVAGEPRVHYYRRGSAAATMEPGCFAPSALADVTWLHLTGITAALSDGCAALLPWLAREARARGARVSYDVNFRSKLWPDAAAARRSSEALLPLVDVVLVGDDEVAALWGVDVDAGLDLLRASGPAEVVVKRGAQGCVAWVEGGRLESPGFPAVVRDPVGAGDAFAAGYLAGAAWGQPPAERLRTANAMGALCVAGHGDYESLPSRRELDAFLTGSPDPGR